MSKKEKGRKGVIYSTDPDFSYQYGSNEEPETLSPEKQQLLVLVDRHHRGGKTVTVVDGFIGKTDDLEALGKALKTKIGAGGSVKDNQIIIQGAALEKVSEFLTQLKYRHKVRK